MLNSGFFISTPFIIVFLIMAVLVHAALYKFFEAAGEKGWKALVPFYSWWVWLGLIGRSKWWILFLILPQVNIVVIIAMSVELLRSFGKKNIPMLILSGIAPFLVLPYVAFVEKPTYNGPIHDEYKRLKKEKKTSSGVEWMEAILFALIAASIIRAFIFEAFTIPTQSMENSLLRNDYLFVSKLHYGSRVPMTPLALPLFHNRMLGQDVKPYREFVQLPYLRLPKFQKIKNNDIVVFNFPAQDIDMNGQIGMVRPVDKRDNYIKRCVGIPGDTLEIDDQILKINGKVMDVPGRNQFAHEVTTKGVLKEDKLYELDIPDFRKEGDRFLAFANDERADKLKAVPIVTAVDKMVLRKGSNNPNSGIFPQLPELYPWNLDNFGKLWVPKKGSTVQLTAQNIALYKRIIDVYEGHELGYKGSQILIDGQPATEYTFKFDYYMMIGDNRHNSLDSRYWGFVPEDHIVGKGWLIFMSVDRNAKGLKKIRWNRIFNRVAKM